MHRIEGYLDCKWKVELAKRMTCQSTSLDELVWDCHVTDALIARIFECRRP